jgi:DNA polymerase zeta
MLPGLCERCRATPAETISGLLSQVRISETRVQTVHKVCAKCTQSEPSEPVRCISLDCPWLFQRMKVEQQAEDIELLQELILGLDLGDDANHKQENRGDSREPRG